MAQTQVNDGSKYLIRCDLSANVPEIVRLPGAGMCSIVIQPPVAGSVTVEFSNSSAEDVAAGNGLFATAEGFGAGGVVTTQCGDEFVGTIAAFRLTASAAGGRVEVAQ